MGMYEYECEGGHRFEQKRSIADRYNVVCPKCKKSVRLRISLSSFKFATNTVVLQRKQDGELTHVGTTLNTPDTEPPRPPAWDRNLVEV